MSLFYWMRSIYARAHSRYIVIKKKLWHINRTIKMRCQQTKKAHTFMKSMCHRKAHNWEVSRQIQHSRLTHARPLHFIIIKKVVSATNKNDINTPNARTHRITFIIMLFLLPRYGYGGAQVTYLYHSRTHRL